MTEMAILAEAAAQQIEHFDVVIVGAGISGVGGAYHLTKQCPGTSFIVLEAQESFGGTGAPCVVNRRRLSRGLYAWLAKAMRSAPLSASLWSIGDRFDSLTLRQCAMLTVSRIGIRSRCPPSASFCGGGQ